MTNEYELKFIDINKDDIRAKLLALHYYMDLPETLMKRQTFHLPDTYPDSKSKWGRVRDEGKRITATIKWYDNPNNPSISEIHEEEIVVSDWDSGVGWLEQKGFKLTAYQENTREAWKKQGVSGLEVVIDTWPGLLPYIEVEALSIEDVYSASIELGFDPSLGMTGGVEWVYLKKLGVSTDQIKSLSEITFKNPPSYKGGVPSCDPKL